MSQPASSINETSPAPLTSLSDEESLFRQSVREFADQQVRPLAAEMDEKGMLQSLADPNRYLSVVLHNGIKTGRLKIFKVGGTRGGYYALVDWVKDDGELRSDMKKHLL